MDILRNILDAFKQGLDFCKMMHISSYYSVILKAFLKDALEFPKTICLLMYWYMGLNS